MTNTISIKIIAHAVKDKLSIQAFGTIDPVKPIPPLYEQLFHLDLVCFIVSSFYFIFTPRQIRLRAASTDTHMNLCRVTAGQYKSNTGWLGLRFTNLFLQFRGGINKCLICQLTTQMLLGDRIGYPDLRSLKKFIPNFRPNMEGRIVVIWHEDSDQFVDK